MREGGREERCSSLVVCWKGVTTDWALLGRVDARGLCVHREPDALVLPQLQQAAHACLRQMPLGKTCNFTGPVLPGKASSSIPDWCDCGLWVRFWGRGRQLSCLASFLHRLDLDIPAQSNAKVSHTGAFVGTALHTTLVRLCVRSKQVLGSCTDQRAQRVVWNRVPWRRGGWKGVQSATTAQSQIRVKSAKQEARIKSRISGEPLNSVRGRDGAHLHRGSTTKQALLFLRTSRSDSIFGKSFPLPGSDWRLDARLIPPCPVSVTDREE
eukprot:1200456-Rhodomonas_salina.1